MCIAYICMNRGKYRLIVMSQRDEKLDRPTMEAHWRNGFLGGMDTEDPVCGTWFGVNKEGRAGILLSITQPIETRLPNAPSRGLIINNYLTQNKSLTSYTQSLLPTATEYNGFTFVGLEPTSFGYSMKSISNLYVDKIDVRDWKEDICVLGNSPPEKPFKKVLRARELFEEVLKDIDNMDSEEALAEALMKVVHDRVQCYPDEQLNMQLGSMNSWATCLSQINIRFPEEENVRYGTRCISVFLVDYDGKCFFMERRMSGDPIDPFNPQWKDVVFRYNLEKSS